MTNPNQPMQYIDYISSYYADLERNQQKLRLIDGTRDVTDRDNAVNKLNRLKEERQLQIFHRQERTRKRYEGMVVVKTLFTFAVPFAIFIITLLLIYIFI